MILSASSWLQPACALATAAFVLQSVLPPSSAYAAPAAPQTEIRYLSGLGPKDAVPWEFSVTAGRRAGEWTTIPVPSNWEQHGFGSYDYGEAPKHHSEHGLYRLRFAVPPAWQGRPVRLVFEGVMTDATVKVNGVAAGPTHIGGFYRFGFDVTQLVKYGSSADNLLEVDVAKVSANTATAAAENKGDYWMFGGIFRPVWLEAAPPQSINHTAIDARADGTLTADVTVAGAPAGAVVEGSIHGADGKQVGQPFSATVDGSASKIVLRTRAAAPRLWTAETPNLYTLRLTLRQGGKPLHATQERFGFRTFEVRKGDGLYLNGKRILIKGVNRHSFRPDTGRALTREDSYADARLIKEMNMNTARMSHYPPDPAFMEAADELGLYVLNELSGWQAAHDTETGRRLVKEMITRDVNHPSILFWDNGNEGGWNRAIDGDFALYDPQKRNVLHPWELHGDVDTKHYPNYALLTQRLQGPNLLLPTEFLHGLYDGGGGAGLDDYWNAITASPYGAGGIFWVFADEGIARTDRQGGIDVFSTYAPDGLVGPRHEKEGSFHTVRHLWSPVRIATPALNSGFDGKLALSNHYDFTSLSSTRFSWRLVRFAGPDAAGTAAASGVSVLASGQARGPSVAPGTSGLLDLALPADWRKLGADALQVTAFGPDGKSLWDWSWATPLLAERLDVATEGGAAAALPAPLVDKQAAETRLVAGDVVASFDNATGALRALSRAGKTAQLGNGPRLAYARAKNEAVTEWLPFNRVDTATGVHRLDQVQTASTIEVVVEMTPAIAYASYKLEISADGQRWKPLFEASRRAGDGGRFEFAPQPVMAVRLTGLAGPDGQPLALKSLRLGASPARFPAVASTPAKLASGVEGGARPTAWLEAKGGNGIAEVRWTLHADGTLQLDYRYALDGEFLFHGVTFDHPEAAMKSVRWLGEGPYRSWQNRMHGTTLGVYDSARNDIQQGSSWTYPEFQGYFAGLRWARLETTAGGVTMSTPTAGMYLRIGTPRSDHPYTSAEYPAGDLSFMHAIPAMGSKFVYAERMGPSGRPAYAAGQYAGRVYFRY
ncbi:glycoside hydrolase family 2 TIM barrel-domain containing protein [Pseudoduganella namucuonensis]|uniref:beta-galactosidase n=1 Tax=Pseudoduganella namucuonensis TaxID=1035707 RepID=A0A1I7KRV2_9BURK|nr:glycoside hydrolase family 2 TIM barrel-domain containing protein [Pseudoduganella namucuonensis]SFV00128.1 Beta-galactosidase/beta-glucuronidase [Pseudoduganella namucuonensis]